jgi:hypothetical protein
VTKSVPRGQGHPEYRLQLIGMGILGYRLNFKHLKCTTVLAVCFRRNYVGLAHQKFLTECDNLSIGLCKYMGFLEEGHFIS